ncbi:hypothetical protein BGZ60DRAFT_534521 [Tricladium varicosporioides]|nr:hypothetical protein BGZ60DRAFT_534521 [Hymenoscyphus varicosporioides]
MNSRFFNAVHRGQRAAANISRYASIQSRMFSCSTVCMKPGVVPVFKETSSPELDGKLQTLRIQHILPNYLSKEQNDLVAKIKHKRTLELEPVVANIAGEEFRLEHVDPMTGKANSRDLFFDALALMKERKDWENLPLLLEGLHKGNSVLTGRPRFREMTCHRCIRAGYADIILECIRRSTDTGMVINSPKIAMSMMILLTEEATRNNHDNSSIKKALARAEQLMDLMEDPKNAKYYTNAAEDPRVRPELVGMALDLASRLSLSGDGAGIDKKVEDFAKKVLGTWPNLESPWTRNASESVTVEREHAINNTWLRQLSTLLHGLKLSQKVLSGNPELASQLKKRADELEQTAAPVYEAIMNSEWGKAKPRAGLDAYKAVRDEVI